MYSRFKINKSVFDNFSFGISDKTKGKSLANNYSSLIENELRILINDENIIDGTATQNEWFPSIKADIFLSHSHRDIDRANEIAGWFKNNFELDVFIDSNIWGNSNKLLKEIDNRYCYKKSTNTYDYDKRNFSTSHVHMMLSNALANMIDKTECLMFLETSNSLIVKDTIGQTESPWIYNELFLSRIIRIDNNLARRKTQTFSNTLRKADSLNESLRIKYDVNLDHLIELKNRDLIDWKDEYKNSKQHSNVHPLDILYNKKIYL